MSCDPSYLGSERSRGQRQDKYLYHFGIFFVIFRNILPEYHIQIKTIKICKLRRGQTMIIIEPLIRTNFSRTIFLLFSQNFLTKLSIFLNFHQKMTQIFQNFRPNQ